MSWNPSLDPVCPDAVAVEAIETLIVPRARDIGGFEVRRALPAPKRQMVGPFIFFDQMGPAEFVSGRGVDVRPHPHIGLATVTYLFRGEFQHRDSLGSNQIILPGAVNWMVAGRGVTHSERTSAAARKAPHSLFGIQTWVTLPEAQEDAQPSFEHHGKESLPLIESDGVSVRLILGQAYGETAPVRVFSETFYTDADLKPGSLLPLPDDHVDRGLGCGPGVRVRRDDGVSSQRPDQRRGRSDRRAPHHPRRRDARRAPLHLVELRWVEPGQDRSRQGAVAQGRLGPRSFRPSSRRPRRIHAAAAAVSSPVKS
jgi:redox-sensitive bicupin YhaK (pirin superfamily)